VKRLIVTGWCGLAHGATAALTLDPMFRYSQRHGCDLDCINLASSAAPPSWLKVPTLAIALQEYDEVLWLDCDVVVSRSQESIFDELPADVWQGMVVHQTECGQVPNCGVWLVRAEAAAPAFRENACKAFAARGVTAHRPEAAAGRVDRHGCVAVGGVVGVDRPVVGVVEGKSKAVEAHGMLATRPRSTAGPENGCEGC
jgi:hypothetical protein